MLAPLGEAVGCRVAAVYGGASMERQSRPCSQAASTSLVATPGRLIDLIERGEVRPRRRRGRSCSTRPTAWPTWASCRRSSGSCATSPTPHQTLLFSATLDGAVDRARPPLPARPGRPRGRVPTSHRRRDGAPLPARAPARQGEGRSRRSPQNVTARSSSCAPSAAPTVSSSSSRKRACAPPRSTATSARRRARRRSPTFTAGKLPVLVATDVAARGHPRRRRRRRRPLRPARRREDLPAPLGSHRTGRGVGPGRHAGPLEPGARGAADAAPARPGRADRRDVLERSAPRRPRRLGSDRCSRAPCCKACRPIEGVSPDRGRVAR